MTTSREQLVDEHGRRPGRVREPETADVTRPDAWTTTTVVRVPGERAVGFGLFGRDAVGADVERIGRVAGSASHGSCVRRLGPASAMIVSAGLALPWVGSTLPSVTNRFGTAKVRRSASTTPCALVGAHATSADEVGVAVDRDGFLGAGGIVDGRP